MSNGEPATLRFYKDEDEQLVAVDPDEGWEWYFTSSEARVLGFWLIENFGEKN